MRKTLARAALAAALLLVAAGAQAAGGLRVLPLKLEASARQLTVQLALTNLTAGDSAAQIETLAWTQTDSGEHYDATADWLFAPPVLGLPAGKTRVVRFRLKRGAPADTELAYRAYVQQLAPPGQDGAGVDVRLRLGIPLFVAPIRPAQPELTAVAVRDAETLGVQISNTGGLHAKFLAVELLDAAGKIVVATADQSAIGSNYLLAKAAARWALRAPKMGDPLSLAPGAYVLRLRTDYYPTRRGGEIGTDGVQLIPLTLS